MISSSNRASPRVLHALWSAVGASSSALQQPLQQQFSATAASAAAAAAAAAQFVPSALLASSRRSFHAGRTLLSSEQELSGMLAQEVKHEKTVYEQDELVAQGPPAPFKLTTKPGDTTVTLTREYKGESISVDASLNMQDTLALPFGAEEGDDEDEEEGDEEEPNDINFNVSVSRAGQALVFECTSDGTYVDIRHVTLEPAAGVESETAYTGPVFGELDDTLQEAFRSYVAERGVNEDLGEYLRHLLYDKEQQEYLRWLEGVSSFVKSS